MFVPLTKEEREIVVERPIVGTGGHQGLLRKITITANRDGLEISFEQIVQVFIYAYDYKDGGYQQRFRTLHDAAINAYKNYRKHGEPSGTLDF